METTSSIVKPTRRELISGLVILFLAAGIIMMRPSTPREGYAGVPEPEASTIEPTAVQAEEQEEVEDEAR